MRPPPRIDTGLSGAHVPRDSSPGAREGTTLNRFAALIVAALAVVGCRDDAVTGPDAQFRRSRAPEHGGRGITVLTRNVYLGANLDPLLTAPAEDLPFLAAQTLGAIVATNFPERARALAAEIARHRPHLVGLQEIELYRVQSPGDAAFGGTVPATDVAFDFLAILLAALAAQGQDYAVAVVQQNMDAEVPAVTGVGPDGVPTFDDIRLTDRDAILARADVAWSNPLAANYAVNLEVSVGGRPLTILRGWTSVDATVRETLFRFANTHLETQVAPPVQIAQARELLAIVGAQPLPVILAGDFNSDADGSQTPTYGILIDAGYHDAWLEDRRRGPGLTCCHEPDLRNRRPTFDQRLDLILYGNGFKERRGSLVGSVRAAVVGDEPDDRTPSGLWPSDHAGVAATLQTPQDERRHVRRKGR